YGIFATAPCHDPLWPHKNGKDFHLLWEYPPLGDEVTVMLPYPKPVQAIHLVPGTYSVCQEPSSAGRTRAVIRKGGTNAASYVVLAGTSRGRAGRLPGAHHDPGTAIQCTDVCAACDPLLWRESSGRTAPRDHGASDPCRVRRAAAGGADLVYRRIH